MTKINLGGGALIVGLGVLGIAAFGLYAWKKGGAGNAMAGIGQAAGGAVIDLAGGAVTGIVGGAGAAVGLPTPSETIEDPAQVRYIIDRDGWFTASKWAAAPALFKAMNMDAGTGVPPPSNSPAARALGYTNAAPSAPAVNLPSWTPSPGTTFEDMSGGSFDYFKWNG